MCKPPTVELTLPSSFCSVMSRKGRRKDKDSPTPPGLGEEQKEYLQEDNLRERVSDADFFKLVAIPPYLDLNEWLATHILLASKSADHLSTRYALHVPPPVPCQSHPFLEDLIISPVR
ncbi:hypothetical protein RRG08_064332 [Elysia crispata]|uniref:Uncharacterized protein n=1 Tax=Elysia crispata TaxID=231223 RepID=A0AAE1B665_9GAST|nr:hypothetical protein RRG08_064332 [Elysia crispata]